MSQPTLLRYADVVSRVEAVAKGREDYVYPKVTVVIEGETYSNGDPLTDAICVYLEDDQTPSCLVGQAFALDIVEVGITPDDQVNQDSVATLFVTSPLGERYQVTRKAARFLAQVQGEQDTGIPWGQAIETAKHQSEGLDDVDPYTYTTW